MTRSTKCVSGNKGGGAPRWGLVFPESTFAEASALEARNFGWDLATLQKVVKDGNRLDPAVFMVITCGKVIVQEGDTARTYKIHSIRKSLMSSLYGVYSDRGVIHLNKNLAQLGIDDKTRLSTDEKRATLRDLLRSRSGVYLRAAGETKAMGDDRPARHAHKPGTHFYYNNWDFNVLGTAFSQLTGQNIFECFQKDIAAPLGMRDFNLKSTHLKYEEHSLHPVYRFRMSARDLACFGLLYLAKGKWRDAQILSSDWIRESTHLEPTSGQSTGTKSGYGYLWWGVSRERYGLKKGILAASGLSTQRIYVVPPIKTVIVFLKNTDGVDPDQPNEVVVGTRPHDLFLSEVLGANRLYRTDSPPRVIS